MRAFIRLACFSLMLAACLPTEPSTHEEFFRNRARWEAREPTGYEFIFQRSSCECLPEWTVPARITVRGGRIHSVVNLATGNPASAAALNALSIDELFAILGDALDQGAYRVSASYDPTFGYPTSIALDYDRETVDDEVAFTARALRSVR